LRELTTKIILALVLGLFACQSAPPERPEDIAPEAATGRREVQGARATRWMVGAANPYASHAGAQILQQGGDAVDAVIAMSLVLTLVEPQSSGIGGGAFLVMRRPDGAVTTWDGRETAPAAATPEMFLDAQGAPRPLMEVVPGGLSVGTPGLLRMLEALHRAHGRLPWAALFAPAIQLAEEGFVISPRLHALLQRDPALRADPLARALYYLPSGDARPAGERLTNPALAQTLRAVAQGGADAFYKGEIAQDIARAVQQDPRNPGLLTAADLAGYQPRERPAVCAPYRQWQVCGMGPPSSGGVTPLQTLGIIEHFKPSASPLDEVGRTHLFLEASRLAFADRARYLADADFVPVPVEALLSPDYLRGRAALIDPARSIGEARAGEVGAPRGAVDRSPELPSTSHLVVVDGDGAAISMTASIEGAFGARLMVRGFLLNNEMTDFSFAPTQDGLPVANRVEPGKRPRSSMAPLLVSERGSGALRLVIGSPGGSRIIPYVTRAVLGVLDEGLDVQSAISRPHVINRNGPTEVELIPGQEAQTQATVAALERLGHQVKVVELNSGLQAIERLPDGALRGGADPRREGLILGQ
jgi:gamma-glutamyltranspeptidase/glutathione hydrolase